MAPARGSELSVLKSALVMGVLLVLVAPAMPILYSQFGILQAPRISSTTGVGNERQELASHPTKSIAPGNGQATGELRRSSINYTAIFFYTGKVQNWTVPNGVTSITVNISGAQGGPGTGGRSGAPGAGGLGGGVQATVSVTPGMILSVFVGGTSGYPGGGTGGDCGYGSGGSGGGYSEIIPGGGTTPLAVAGGGGGGGGIYEDTGAGNGGAGATPITGSGTNGTAGGGGGGGIGGNRSGGGAGGTGYYQNGSPGGYLSGGAGGANCGQDAPGGGGGGGGYYGGGGGGDGPVLGGSGGGGGGGDSCVPISGGCSALATYSAYQIGDGHVYILAALVAGTVGASQNPVDVGQTVTFISTAATGGGGNYTYSWNNLPTGTGCTSANKLTIKCTPSKATGSSISVSVTVTDANGNTATSALLFFTVNSDTLIRSFSTSRNAIDLGAPTTFTVSVSNGTPSYTYQYTGLPAGCDSFDTASLGCTPAATGSFTVRVYVNDSTSYSANATLNLKVNTDEKIGSFSASPNSTVVGTSIRFAVSVSGGTPPYSYLYSSLPTGCSSSDVASLICTPTASGNYTTTVNVKDAAGGSTNASTSLTVTKFNPYLHIVSFVASPATIVQGTSTNFSAVVAGGALMYTYDYSNLPLGCSSVNMSAFQCTPTETGNFNVSVKVTDARGNTTSAITSLIVIPSSGSWPTILSVTLTPNPVVVGQAIKVSVRVTGGVPPYTYVYVNLPPGCLPSNSTPVSCKPTSPGNYTLLVTVIDSAGRRTEASTLLVVTGPIVPLTVSLLANVSSVMVGQPFYLEAQVVGGEGQFLYYWSLNGTNVTGAPDSSIWNITLNHPGTYTYRVWVEDLRGVMVGSQSVQVTASGPGNSSGLQFPWWILLVILVVVVIVILLLIGYRRQVPKQARTGQTRVVSTTGGAGATDAAATGSTKTGPDADTSGRPPLPAPSRSSGKKCSKCGGPLDPDMTCPACSASSRIKPETGSEKPHTTGRMSVAGLFASRSPSHAADGKGSKADAEQTGPPVTIKCIICGTELDGDYCKVCNMHWDA